MREYRGKSIDNKEFVYGSLLEKDGKCFIVSDFDTLSDGENTDLYAVDWYEVDPETVGQYTGLKDRSGKEIYEGDILQDDEGRGEVEWVQEHCGYMVFTRNPSMYHRLDSDGHLNLSEVIGTRWDNPELLEGEKI